ncbi:MAG: GNAT family N-acetyltransferase [Clostridiales bacterium]|nr:GNAT family N-acetyltransferase [Clostridiales bacterium]
MNIIIKEFDRKDIRSAIEIWNEVVDEGLAFPQLEDLTEKTGIEFFEGQSFTGLAFDADTGETVGIYILHPNNVGRCGHLCNASYAVKSSHRGHGIGEELVCHCIKTAPKKGFKILQFNAVVATNTAALGLYKKLGFTPLGVIPEGFLLKNGTYEDIIPHYITL